MEAAETSLGRPDVEGENETAVPGGGGGPASARSSPGPDTDKIYKLLSEIQVIHTSAQIGVMEVRPDMR